MTNLIDEKDSKVHANDGEPLSTLTGKKIAAAVGVVALIQAAGFGLVYHFIANWAERGQFGDLFGVTNSFFSGLAFAGLIYTIYLQSRQIEIQAREIRRGEINTQESLRLSSESVGLANEELQIARKRERLELSVILLNHYEGELKRIRDLDNKGLGYSDNSIREVRAAEKTVALKRIVDAAYTELAG